MRHHIDAVQETVYNYNKSQFAMFGAMAFCIACEARVPSMDEDAEQAPDIDMDE